MLAEGRSQSPQPSLAACRVKRRAPGLSRRVAEAIDSLHIERSGGRCEAAELVPLKWRERKIFFPMRTAIVRIDAQQRDSALVVTSGGHEDFFAPKDG